MTKATRPRRENRRSPFSSISIFMTPALMKRQGLRDGGFHVKLELLRGHLPPPSAAAAAIRSHARISCRLKPCTFTRGERRSWETV